MAARRRSLREAAVHAAILSGRAIQSMIPRGRKPRWREASLPGGTLRMVGGHPLLRLSGSRYRMGLAHGTLLRDEVRYLRSAYLEAFYGSRTKRPAYWPVSCSPNQRRSTVPRTGSYAVGSVVQPFAELGSSRQARSRTTSLGFWSFVKKPVKAPRLRPEFAS